MIMLVVLWYVEFINLIKFFLFHIVMLLVCISLFRCIRILDERHYRHGSFILVLLRLGGTSCAAPWLRITEDIIPMCRISFLVVLLLRFILFACFRLIQHYRMNLSRVSSVFHIFTLDFIIFDEIFKFVIKFIMIYKVFRYNLTSLLLLTNINKNKQKAHDSCAYSILNWLLLSLAPCPPSWTRMASFHS